MRRAVRAATLGIGFLLVAMGAGAEEYPGWGDTGWVYGSKRDCCNGAMAIAQQYSAQACINAGGVPSPFAGGVQQGSCQWNWMQDANGNMIYRCYSESSVWCR